MRPREGMTTPWGAAQGVEDTDVDGIYFVWTSGHGGYYVAAEVEHNQPLVPNHRWYEEDCEWSRVALAYPEAFPPKAAESAQRVYDYWILGIRKDEA